jgi:hypothetical protein
LVNLFENELQNKIFTIMYINDLTENFMKLLKKISWKFATAIANRISINKSEAELLALGALLSKQQFLSPPP